MLASKTRLVLVIMQTGLARHLGIAEMKLIQGLSFIINELSLIIGHLTQLSIFLFSIYNTIYSTRIKLIHPNCVYALTDLIY